MLYRERINHVETIVPARLAGDWDLFQSPDGAKS
jgi:hypothetical protein